MARQVSSESRRLSRATGGALKYQQWNQFITGRSIEYLHRIFDYLVEHDITMYRMSSDVAPYVTHPKMPRFHNQIQECRSELLALLRLRRDLPRYAPDQASRFGIDQVAKVALERLPANCGAPNRSESDVLATDAASEVRQVAKKTLNHLGPSQTSRYAD